MNKNKQTEGKKTNKTEIKTKQKKQDTKREKNLDKMILIFGLGLLNSYFGLISFAFLFLSFNLFCVFSFCQPERPSNQNIFNLFW